MWARNPQYYFTYHFQFVSWWYSRCLTKNVAGVKYDNFSSSQFKYVSLLWLWHDNFSFCCLQVKLKLAYWFACVTWYPCTGVFSMVTVVTLLCWQSELNHYIKYGLLRIGKICFYVNWKGSVRIIEDLEILYLIYI